MSRYVASSLSLLFLLTYNAGNITYLSKWEHHQTRYHYSYKELQDAHCGHNPVHIRNAQWFRNYVHLH